MATTRDNQIYLRDWLTVPQAAARLGVSPTILRSAVRSGELPAYCAPGTKTLRLSWAEVDRWMRRHEIEPGRSQQLPAGASDAARPLHPVAVRQLARARAQSSDSDAPDAN